ncbi:MAG: circularly permuted type 2 ATP-grasp protein [Alphaproteobacteria bacterium]|nr:circularly permuted type 2 ATP-grasp protein [Alphaproteobacteria bacterium]
MNILNYDPQDFYDELFIEQGKVRSCAKALISTITKMPDGELQRRQKAAEASFMDTGITFAVYGNKESTEKIIPFDVIPRIVDAKSWEPLEKGLQQRTYAMNCFLNDIYGEQKILKDKVIPEQLVKTCIAYRKECDGLKPPRSIWAHITGTDLVRDKDGTFYVLEDNMRCPSGVSYVLQNRRVLKQTFPQVFSKCAIRSVDAYPTKLREMLKYLAPDNIDEPNVVVLTPGIYNSAYYEHSFLAQQMGVDLVCGNDLVVQDNKVYEKTTKGLKQVHVIYRRIDDDFLDPKVFRADSVLGVPGIFDAYKSGNVALANAPGCGVADDKAIYSYVPKIIKYYLDEDNIIPNVPTYVCDNEKDKKYVIENIAKMVVKAVGESGGYGMLVGPQASKNDLEEFKNRINSNPRNYIAQPLISLSRVPTLVEGNFEGRHVDLRPYIIQGKEIYVLPGGLTRVALKRGSYVVNSSQGGGAKDTWVMSKQKNEGEDNVK